MPPRRASRPPPTQEGFLARNGLACGKVYGFATDIDETTGGLFMDDFHKESVTGHGVPGAQVEGAFEPIDWRWDGTVKDFVHDGSWEFQHDAPSRAEINWRETAPPRPTRAHGAATSGSGGAVSITVGSGTAGAPGGRARPRAGSPADPQWFQKTKKLEREKF